jgi:low affinity Fe/Cu permease
MFERFATLVAAWAGSWMAFMLAVGIIAAWGITGPFFAWSDTWQLIINTGTTIVTFVMVFLIQATQNRDTAAINGKLDEILHCLPGRESDRFIALDRRPSGEIEQARREIGG